MSTLTRNDGTQFVMQTYRELLTQQKRALLVQQISLLSEQHGQFVRLFKHQSGQYDAVFSTDPGYLLGESVKHYFGQLSSLIFCEVLPDSQHVIVVVVREGSVYLDTLISPSNLYQELLPLMSGDHPFHIFTSGELPLKATASDEHFAFPTELVESFEYLDEPLFPRLPALRSLQLLPLPLALKAEHLTAKSRKVGLAITLAVLGVITWSIFSSSQDDAFKGKKAAEAQPFQHYYAALTTPSPEQQLDELAHLLSSLYLMPGWEVDRTRFDGKRYTMTVSSHGGTLSMLNEWVKQNQWAYGVTPQAATLTRPSLIKRREKPTTIYNNSEVLTVLIDRLHHLLQDRSIQLKKTTQRGSAKESELIIRIKDGSPALLKVIGSALDGLPITLSAVNITSTRDSLTGTLYISAWGA